MRIPAITQCGAKSERIPFNAERRRAITFSWDDSQLKIQLPSAPSTSIRKLDQLKAQHSKVLLHFKLRMGTS